MAEPSNIIKRKNQFTHPWTRNEVDFVVKNIKLMSYKQMSKTIFRSISSIQSKVRFLDVKKKIDKHTLNQEFFKKWSEQMAYVLGFFDGDGSVWESNRSSNKRITSVFYTASIEMAKFLYNKIRNICSKFTGKIQKIPTPTKKRLYYSIALGHRDSLLLYKYLYEKATIFLERKHNIFKKNYDN